MIVSTTQYRQLSREGVKTDYYAAQPLPGEIIAAESKDRVDILSPKGDLLHTSRGGNLEANLKGDVFWTRDQNIMKWSADEGETTFAEGYSRYLPGPDGKVFAIGYNPDSEFRGATVDLLDAEGKLVSRAPLPAQFKITGAYISHDQSKVLIGGWADNYSDPYADPYVRPADVFSLEVDDNGQLKMTNERSSSLNALSQKDCQPFLLQDGRVGVAEQLSYKVGGRTANHDRVWEILGPGAAAGGRPADFSGTNRPLSTLDEQIAAIYPDTEASRYHVPPEGTPMWPPLGGSEGGLVDLTPTPPAPPAPPEEVSPLRSNLLPLSSGGLGLGAGVALFAAGLGPIGVGVGLIGLAGAGVLKWLSSRRQEDTYVPTPLEPIPHLVDPKLGESLKESLDLTRAPSQTFGTTKVSQSDRAMVVEFPTGMVATREGEKLRLYGPTGEEKTLPKIKSFNFDSDSGVMTVNGTIYNLVDGSVTNGKLKVEGGVVSTSDGSSPPYLGRGVFSTGQRDKLTLPLPPEVFSNTVGYEKTHASGEIFTRTKVLLASGPSFKLVEQLDTLKAPEYSSDGTLKQPEEKLQSTTYRVTLNDGRVLAGDAKGATLNGKELKNTSLSIQGDSITLRKEEYGKYYERRPKESFWDQVGDLLVPGTRDYETKEAKDERVNRQLDLTIHADGEVELAEYRRAAGYGAEFERTSHSVGKVGDPEIGANFEKVL